MEEWVRMGKGIDGRVGSGGLGTEAPSKTENTKVMEQLGQFHPLGKMCQMSTVTCRTSTLPSGLTCLFSHQSSEGFVLGESSPMEVFHVCRQCIETLKT